MDDSWKSGDSYEYYMGRWSKLVAEQFIDWLPPGPGLRWVDVGCGSGSLTEAIISRCDPEAVTAIDQSEGFIRTAQRRFGNKVNCKVGNALSLPLDDASFDFALSGLVLNFIPKPEKALSEMQRVTRKGGTVAVYIWDYPGKMEFLNYFWDIAVELNPGAADLHEGRRFSDANAEQLMNIFNRVGLSKIEAASFEIVMKFSDFDDYWGPFLGGQGPAPTYVSNLNDADRNQLRDALAQRLPFNEDGSIFLNARAWATKGIV